MQVHNDIEGDCLKPLARHMVRGRSVIIRRACKGDRDAMIRFYSRLSSETLYSRFMSIIRYFDPYVDKLLSNSRSVVILAVDEETGDVVGIAEAIGDESGEAAESGIAVLESYQGAGLGTAMAKILLSEARREGFKKLYAYLLAGNIAAKRLAEKFGAKYVGFYGDMIRMELEL